MPRTKLNPFQCPACGNGSLVEIEIDERIITEAERLPAVVTTNCGKNHTLVVFVDGKFKIRDIEVASAMEGDSKDAFTNTEDWFGSF
ncbi:MAG: hypothetical protein ACFFAX_10300 [Promethearchaeota archaeon]